MHLSNFTFVLEAVSFLICVSVMFPISCLIWRSTLGLDSVDSGPVPSTLLHGSGLAWRRPRWQPCEQDVSLLSLQVEILPQGRESPIFKQFFKNWK